jgi:UDP-glucose:glycoprotein glucosyltransferase
MGNPPRGLQITLGTETQPVVVDTIVMANLGYFQLKANPGAWLLRLRQGRSADIFDIVRLGDTILFGMGFNERAVFCSHTPNLCFDLAHVTD